MKSLNEIDLEGDSPTQTGARDLDKVRIARLIGQWDDAQSRKQRAEQLLKQANAEMMDLEQNIIPAAMTEAGLREFKTTTGRTVKIEIVARGNIPAPSTVEKAKGEERVALERRRESALAYVAKTWPGLIKTEVSVAVGRGEAGVAARIAQLIRDQFALVPDVSEGVNPATLNAHFKELNAAGSITEVPADLFALYVGPLAKIK